MALHCVIVVAVAVMVGVAGVVVVGVMHGWAYNCCCRGCCCIVATDVMVALDCCMCDVDVVVGAVVVVIGVIVVGIVNDAVIVGVWQLQLWLLL